MFSTILNHTIADYALSLMFGKLSNNFQEFKHNRTDLTAFPVGSKYVQMLVAFRSSSVITCKFHAFVLEDVTVLEAHDDGGMVVSHMRHYLGQVYDNLDDLMADCMFDTLTQPKWVQLYHTEYQPTTTISSDRHVLLSCIQKEDTP